MEIKSYSRENLILSLKNEHTTDSQFSSKAHFTYLTDYLGEKEGLGAKQIVVEQEYINKDFLSDYSSYYSTCFFPYGKTCKRVHFFSKSFTDDEFHNAILSEDKNQAEVTKQIWDSYLGFVVVKPIPITTIGFTLLRSYPGTREFFGVREYHIHVFGKEISMESLAFQEQDSVLSACATTAIWSLLHKTAFIDFHTVLKTPNEITRSAGRTAHDGNRLFPNKHGLSLGQMCNAIVNGGLETEIRHVATQVSFDTFYVKELISGYSSIGIPIILVISVFNTEDLRKQPKDYFLHAVTVVGYNQSIPFPLRQKQEKVHLISDSINKFYVHDDQWGPFARMEFKEENSIISPWDLLGKGYTNIETVLIPVFPKVRISYDDVKEIVVSIDKVLFEAYSSLSVDFAWEIKLELSENYKKTIRKSFLPNNIKLKILTQSCPKYIWRASCFFGENRLFDLLFDATDVSANMIAREIVFFTEDVKNYLKEVFQNRHHFRTFFTNENYLDFLKKSVQ